MATYVLIHGAGDVGWYWHLVAAELERRGHTAIAPDMPIDDETAALNDYADAVIAAVPTQESVIVVAQSFGGYVAPIVASRIPTDLIVLVAAMVPAPGESASEMFETTGYKQEPQDDESDLAVFYHDVDRKLAELALSKGRDQAEHEFTDPWPLTAWPDIPTRYVLATNDRLFPAAWTRKVVANRLANEPDEIASGHCVALARPIELVDVLTSYGHGGRIDANR